MCSRPYPPSFISPSSFVCSPKRLCSNRRTYTLHRLLLQGHILPSRGPLHPRPVPLVLQVVLVLSTYVIDWGLVFDVLDITGNSFCVFTSSPPLFLAPLLFPFYLLHNSFSFPFCSPPPAPLPHVLKLAPHLLAFFIRSVHLVCVGPFFVCL